ncbi:MAG: hypothetical protein BAJALOKI2v1_250037 [Promethearchaeota archaeon]|nr:MAG: hypothetical protein BAJALOKI2v1_250037 [Candidatus Lokiarchaeota archaeon]
MNIYVAVALFYLQREVKLSYSIELKSTIKLLQAKIKSWIRFSILYSTEKRNP